MIIVGLDLSLRSTGMCLMAPGDTPDLVKTSTIHEIKLPRDAQPLEHVRRRQRIAQGVLNFIQWHRVDAIYYEAVLTHNAYDIVGLAKLLGVVEAALVQEGFEAQPISLTSARKTALGRVPRGVKKAKWQKPIAVLREWGSDDEIDAFLVANHAIKTLGLPYWQLSKQEAA